MRWWPFSRQGRGNDAGQKVFSGVRHGETVPRVREAMPRIKAEFERARRYERSVTVAVFALPHGTSGDAGSRSLASVLPAVVREATRQTDLVTCDDVEAQRCIVVMPEIGYEEGRRAVARMRQLCAERLGCEVQADLAVFPRDGWLFLDLVELAQRQAGSAPRGALPVPASNPAM